MMPMIRQGNSEQIFGFLGGRVAKHQQKLKVLGPDSLSRGDEKTWPQPESLEDLLDQLKSSERA